MKKGNELHEVYKALYNCASLDVVFCIDQSASMYRPAYATKDLQCDDSFGAGRTQESTPETIAATGEIPRAEFIQKMKTDTEFAECATHYSYYIARSAGHKDKSGAWFIIRYDAETGKFHGHLQNQSSLSHDRNLYLSGSYRSLR